MISVSIHVFRDYIGTPSSERKRVTHYEASIKLTMGNSEAKLIKPSRTFFEVILRVIFSSSIDSGFSYKLVKKSKSKENKRPVMKITKLPMYVFPVLFLS